MFLFFLLFYKLVLSVSLFFVLCLPDVDGGNESCEARFTAIGDGPFFYYFYISISLIISFFMLRSPFLFANFSCGKDQGQRAGRTVQRQQRRNGAG